MTNRDIDLEETLKDSPELSPLAAEGIHFKVNSETAEKLEMLRRDCGWTYVDMLQEAIDSLLKEKGEKQ